MNTPGITVLPANQASWEDLQTVLGDRGDPARCQCQGYKIREKDWRSVPIEERAHRFREQTDCGHPDSSDTSGLVAYLGIGAGRQPVGWCAVEPRTAFQRLLHSPVPWSGRSEDRDDDGVWAVTCFVTRAGYRRQGVMTALAAATVDFARRCGARAVEAYPMVTQPDVEITWGELHVGSRGAFAAAGYREVTHPTKRRFVMRVDFE